ncbi:hypothetical protein MASR1M107_08960 [Ignavibacteriales bacterium]
MGKPKFTKRKRPFKSQIPVFFIFCEGKNTEPVYFNSFRISTVKIKTLGVGLNTLGLVEKAIRRINMERFDATLDQKWCVFDKDDFPSDLFDKAIDKAEKNGFGVAWSNQSFEYWLLLHFEDHQGGSLHRDDYKSRINRSIKDEKAQYNIDSKKRVSEAFFKELSAIEPVTGVPRLHLAISRAARIHKDKILIPPSGTESCTTVYKLMEILIEYVE